MMKYTKHATLGWNISKIGFGAASLSGQGGGYGFGHITDMDARELVLKSIDCGVNLFDTAPIYGFGQSERALGDALKGIREKAYIVSKAGVTWHENRRVDMSNDPKVIQRMFEQSLRDLKTDYIDTYMIHWPDQNVDIRDSLDILVKIKEKGQIRSIGLCNTHLEDLLKALEVTNIEFIQSEFNLFNSGFSGIEELIKQKSIYTMGWGTFDKGILAGSVDSGRVFSKEDCRSWAPWWKKSNWKKKCDAVNEISNIKEIALNYSFENMDSSLCGIKNFKQLDELLKIMDSNSKFNYEAVLAKIKI